MHGMTISTPFTCVRMQGGYSPLRTTMLVYIAARSSLVPSGEPGLSSLYKTRCSELSVTFVLVLFCLQNLLLPHPIRPTAVHLKRAVMTTSRPQIAQSSEPFALTFAVQGRAVFHQRSSGQWQPEAFAAGMSSSSMVDRPRRYGDLSW